MSSQGLSSLTTHDIQTEYYVTLEQSQTPWVDEISVQYPANSAVSEFPGVERAAKMSKKTSGRTKYRTMTAKKLTVYSEEFEDGVEVKKKEIDRDQTGQIMAQVRNMATGVNDLWPELLTQLIESGENTVSSLDGQYWFDQNHVGPNGTTQSNKVSLDIGTTLQAMTDDAAVELLQTGIETILGMKDSVNKPWNSNARNFLCMIPLKIMSRMRGAATKERLTAGATNPLYGDDYFNLTVIPNLLLTNPDKLYFFRLDSPLKPLIRIEEEPPDLISVAEGSELERLEGVHRHAVRCWRGVGLGYWQYAAQIDIVHT